MTNGLRLRVAFFKTEGGREPVREWLLDLPRAERQAIGTDLLDVQYGWPVGMPLVRKLDADLRGCAVILGTDLHDHAFRKEGFLPPGYGARGKGGRRC